jgi:hypothetical protein
LKHSLEAPESNGAAVFAPATPNAIIWRVSEPEDVRVTFTVSEDKGDEAIA